MFPIPQAKVGSVGSVDTLPAGLLFFLSVTPGQLRNLHSTRREIHSELPQKTGKNPGPEESSSHESASVSREKAVNQDFSVVSNRKSLRPDRYGKKDPFPGQRSRP